MKIFLKNIDIFKRLFDFDDSDIKNKIEFKLIMEKRQIEEILRKQKEVSEWNESKLNYLNESIGVKFENTTFKNRQENASMFNEKLITDEDENKYIVFKNKKHEYLSFEFLGEKFNSNILKEYSYYKNNLNN